MNKEGASNAGDSSLEVYVLVSAVIFTLSLIYVLKKRVRDDIEEEETRRKSRREHRRASLRQLKISSMSAESTTSTLDEETLKPGKLARKRKQRVYKLMAKLLQSGLFQKRPALPLVIELNVFQEKVWLKNLLEHCGVAGVNLKLSIGTTIATSRIISRHRSIESTRRSGGKIAHL